MSKVEAPNPLKTWGFGGCTHYSEWPRMADAVIEAPGSYRPDPVVVFLQSAEQTPPRLGVGPTPVLPHPLVPQIPQGLLPVVVKQQFPLLTCESYTTYVGGRLSEHFDHPFLSFEATCTIRTDTIPGGKQVHFAVQTQLRHGDGK